MKSRIAIAASAVIFGTAFTAVPAFAQKQGARNGPEIQQESSGTVAPEQQRPCVYFQLGCSDKPYPMQSASTNGEQRSARTGRMGSEHVRVGERERVSSERLASNRGVRGHREQPRYYNRARPAGS